ncbi:hypothetical protein CapIbe_016329 [Capra ibex]
MALAPDRSSQMIGECVRICLRIFAPRSFRCTDGSYPVPSGDWALSPGDSGAVGTSPGASLASFEGRRRRRHRWLDVPARLAFTSSPFKLGTTRILETSEQRSWGRVQKLFFLAPGPRSPI